MTVPNIKVGDLVRVKKYEECDPEFRLSYIPHMFKYQDRIMTVSKVHTMGGAYLKDAERWYWHYDWLEVLTDGEEEEVAPETVYQKPTTLYLRAGVTAEDLIAFGFRSEEDTKEEMDNGYGEYGGYPGDCLSLDIGEGRRGQSYYLLADVCQGTVGIYSSEPDGSGTSCDISGEVLRFLTSDMVREV